MKHKILCLAFAALAAGGVESYAGVEAMTPLPKQMTVGTGSLALPSSFTVGYSSNLTEEMVAEVTKFVNSLKASTGLNITATQGEGFITVDTNAALGLEAYNLNVAADGVTIDAATPTGLYYAFQSVKKLLPANVIVEVAGESGASYELPVVAINDEPRFEYRGFMLDVSRHFFDVDQVKKMLDIMAAYKLNRFHWHLTDDQGWRLPVPKWPKLTVEGATNKNILLTNFNNGVDGTQWRAGEDVIYGPYAYTPEQIKEVVAYAKERHIEVIPEIDMPGHMVAAIHAYPEFSTSDSYDHVIWNTGGVSKDVLDVSNPKVIEFVKDVIDVLAEYFPYEQIHLGGEECPTEAWANSPACQAFKAEKGLTSDRALQSWFFKEIADYAKEKYGKSVCAWNEIVTSGGTDMNMVNQVKPMVYCWTGGEGVSNNNGLKHVYTGFNGGYYINRAYAGIDKVGAVKDGSLRTTLNVAPPTNEHCVGVQGTFWTEQVDRNEDVEYLALPRLIGIAEQGWSSVLDKDADEIIERFINEIPVLQAGGYNYGAHQLVTFDYRTPEADAWYTLTTTCSDDRAGRAFELKDGKLMGVALSGSDAQQFKFVENPDVKGQYAIVCKAQPEGSVEVAPTAVALSGRWNYSNGMHYGFKLDRAYYGEVGDNDFRYAISSIESGGQWMNFSRSGQGFAINVYNSPNDGSGGLVVFTKVEGGVEPGPGPEPGDFPEENVYYRLQTRFNGDQGQARYGSVIELMRDSSKGNNSREDRLWSNAPVEKDAENYNHQLFKFELDPNGSGYYAMISRAKPNGSVNSTPSESTDSNVARWDYDNETKHYGFSLVADYQGTDANGNHYSAITSKDAAEGWYMNTSAAGQGFAIHLWNNPADQDAGIYTFIPMEKDGQDSISNIEAAPAANAIFDLSGRRLAAPQRGINIINGQKVLVR